MRDNAITAIKALAIIGVVLVHSANRRFEDSSREILFAIMVGFRWCVLAFFAASGWLHARSEAKEAKPGGFVVGRTRRLLVPYFALVMLYSAAWEVVEALAVCDLRVSRPESFRGKIAVALWPMGPEIAGQLYFLPLLFGISTVLHAALRAAGVRGVVVLAMLAFATGVAFFPHTAGTGMNPGVFVWGVFSYAAGYLLFLYRNPRQRTRGLLVCAALLLIWIGPAALLKLVPIALVTFAGALRLEVWTPLHRIGDASGTIFAYHSPFLQGTLLITASLLPGVTLQVVGALTATAVTILVCCGLHSWLRNTSLRWVLL
ncbi:MAG TPA: acyltransferase [Opitutaceae bacterium]